MRTSRALFVLLACVLLLLAACGSNNAAVCIPAKNISPPMETHGEVAFATDHSIYAPGELMVASVTNHLRAEIKSQPVASNCPHILLERQVNSSWQPVPVCPPLPGGDTQVGTYQPILLRSGQTYTATIHTGYATPGIYRVAMSYQVEPSRNAYEYETAYSNTIQFCTCGKCG